jgi:hypothetical protein
LLPIVVRRVIGFILHPRNPCSIKAVASSDPSEQRQSLTVHPGPEHPQKSMLRP